MAADPNTLPLLLVGPVLRRVEADLVSVFVATSRPCSVTLHVWNGPRDAPAAGALPQTDASYVSAAQTTRALGPRLHVLVVVLDLRVPGGNATHGAGALTAGGEYAYDLVFDAGDGTPRDLATLGLLAAADPARHFVPLGYDTNRLPTFLTPPSEADKLVLLHGSCRRMFDGWPIDDDLTLRDGAGAAIEPEAWQPPAGWAPPRPSFADPFADSTPGSFPDDALPTGPKIDGLRWVDALIDNGRRGLGWEKRPHQLFLTGDQVYADDVPAVFIAALNHLGRLLVGAESLPWLKRKKNGTQRRDDQPAEPDASAADLDHFPPGERRRLVLELGGFSTSDGESHLLSFGEFAAYYLLTWSPELWAWPGVFPTPQDYGKPAGAPLYEHEAPATWLEAVSADERAALDAYALEHPSPQIPAASAGVDEDARAGWLYGRISARNQQYDVNAANFAFRSWRFRRDLARVRRALANVPTYMVMDDHEVTDDWYTSRRWRDQVYSRPLGVATVRNGLAAYSAFQAWGNDPRAFAAVGSEERTLLDRIVSWAAAPSPNPGTTSPAQDALQASLGLPHAAAGPASTFRPLVSFSYAVEGPAHRVLVLDGRTCRRFPTRRAIAGCLDYVGPDGLFSSSPMGRALPPRPANDEKLVFVVAAIPVLGPDVMELVLVPFQRLTRLGSSIDAEAWAYEPGTYEALLWALGRYQRVVLLSGDIHMGFSVALDHWAKLPGDAVRPARIVQLTASGLTQDWGSKTGIFSQNALGQEILQAVTLEGAPAERVGWGRPVLLAPGTPEPLGSLVDTGTARAHPALQERLDGPTKAVPTRGWPAGAHEAREPNWAWRCSMVRDVRPEGTSAPEVDGKRWTPLLLPDEPLGSATGPGADWHAQALFRLRFGRVFAYQPHVGVVTLRKRDNQWSVRHVLAGELPPASVAASIGSPAPVVPAGVLPWVVHEASLEPPAASVWDTPERPTVKGGEAWGVDPTDSSIDGLLYYIPKLWAWALGRLGQIVPPLPLGADGAARDAALDAVADSMAAPFRRQILREIGPLARLSDAALDALPDDLSAHANELGAFNLRSEARKLVRPDVKRIADLQRAGSDRARLLDEVLLVAISDVIWDRAKDAEGTSGSLARTLLQLVSFASLFRQPTTRSVPGTRDLLVGLWETWRHHTLHDWWVPSSTPPAARAVAGFGAILPRLVAMAIQVFRLVWRGIADPAPVAPDTKNAFSAELMLGIGGVFGALKFPRRLQIVSGWELAAPPLETATRRGDRSDETLARQRLSFTVYPHESRRFDEPTAWGTIGLVPPLLSADGETVVEKPELLVAGLGNARVEKDLGGGFTFVFNVALGGGARLRLPWAPEQSNATMGGGEISFAVERPYDLEFGGATLHLTPSLRLAFGVAGAVEGAEPFAAIALTLNEGQDKLRVKPETDGFLARLLPVDGIPIPLDLSIGWHSAKGLHWLGAGEALRPLVDDGSQPPPATGPALRSLAEGQGQPAPVGAANFDPVTPMNVKLGLVTLDQRSVSLAFADAAGKPGILVDVKGRLTFSLGPVRLSIIGIGARLGGVLDAEAEGVDMVERVIDLQPPTGLALSITHAAFSGGGFLERIKQGTTTIWRGAVALRMGDRVDVSAFGVVRTSPGAWSMLIFLAGDIPPVPLGLGFRLTGVGGALGLHRRMDDDALADSLLRGEPAAETLLFPEDPQNRLPELLTLADRFFPAQHGTHVFGPLVELDWKLAGLKAARLRAALLFQLGGGVKAALVGAVKLGLPSLDHPYAFSATAGVAATYDHDAGELMLAVSITEAKLFSTINLGGGAALLARWGRDRAFAFTLGGFHPRFRPHIPAGLIEPRRLAAHWSPVDALRLDLEAYFAITHASVQAGGSASVWAGKSWGHAEGRVQVDLMIWWEPDFRLEADLSARLTLSLFGADLMSASFSGSLAGPKPWRFEGSVSWTTCGVEFSKDLSFGWGSGSPAATTTVAARELLRAELEGAGAWATSRPGRLPIILRPGSGEAALFPRDRLELRQTRLPLRVPVDASKRNRLSDPGTWDVVLLGGGVEESSLTDTFPVQRYRRQKTDEPYRGGLRSGARYAGQQIAFAPPVADDTDGTEDAVIDDRLRPERVNVRVDLVLTLATGLVVAAPTRARDRAFDRYFAALKVSE